VTELRIDVVSFAEGHYSLPSNADPESRRVFSREAVRPEDRLQVELDASPLLWAILSALILLVLLGWTSYLLFVYVIA
jgi:hypothetical protein